MTLVKRIITTVVWVAAITAALLSITLFAASQVGVAKGLVVISGSMEPGIATGSFVVARPVDADSVEVGDVVAVRSVDGRSIIHRTVETTPGPNGDTILRLKGDANNAVDEELYITSEVLSPMVIVPGAGSLVVKVNSVKTALLGNPLLLAGLVLGAGLVVVASRLNRSSDELDEDDDAADEDDAAVVDDLSLAEPVAPSFRFVTFGEAVPDAHRYHEPVRFASFADLKNASAAAQHSDTLVGAPR